ncbi:MAG: hypothetical protein NTW66_00795 [Candidatus Magasanikbacteria bacterium]|nr:hypothetical protein [Candidatus Magasanikbacteria bacterium]
MADNTMITVKKPDGTIEKISLADFKARKNKPAPALKPAITPVTPAPAPQTMRTGLPHPNPLLSKEREVSAPPVQPSRPVLKKSVPNLAAIKLLASEIIETENVPAKPVLPPKIQPIARPPKLAAAKKIALNPGGIKALAAEIVQSKPEIKPAVIIKPSMPKPVPPVLKIIEDRKTPMPAKPAAPAPTARFGKNDATSLLEEEIPPAATVGKPLVKPMGMPTALMKESEDVLPSTSSPVNTFVRAPQTMRTGLPHPSPLLSKDRETSAPPVRPIVRDITPARPSNLGPIDEIEFMSLTDFRRLSSNPAEAASRLKQKFLNLREESYVWYLDGLAAWRRSPLFIDYSGAVTEALNTKKKLSEILSADTARIQIPEIQAIIEMEKELL